MNSTKLHKYSSRNLELIKDLGRGSYGNVQLFYHKELQQHVVGKKFSVSGNQESIKKRCAEAEREAKILARIKHKHIIRVLGITEGKCRCFTIILEYASCGDLENLLLNGTDIPLPWAIRARFFVELADALNYLHYHDHKRSYLHGDLKPQNILLGDLLKIKVADFGATSIAKLTGATSLTISGVGNTQHTPYYTAPEFLQNTNMRRNCSMDVYSYGMIGYEIITRKEVYSGSQVSYKTLLNLITATGQKPDESCVEKVSKTLKKNSSESVMFHKLNEIVHQCWQTEAKDRPKISQVKEQLDNLALKEQIYDKVTNTKVRSLISRRKLKPPLPVRTMKPSSKKSTNKKSKKTCVVGMSALCISIIGVLIAAMMRRTVFRQSVSKNATVVFLGVNVSSFKKYVINSKFKNSNVSTLLRFPEAYASNSSVPDFVEVRDLVYLTNSFGNNKDTLVVDLSKPSLKWKRIKWKDEYKRRKYIAYKDTIMAVGTYYDHMNSKDANKDLFGSFDKTFRALRSFQARMYNTTTNKWTQLPNMKEPRLGHTLAIFQGLICAVGGFLLPQSKASVECYNPKTNQWSSLPPMKIARKFAAAVELNSELYVIGGMKTGNDWVEDTDIFSSSVFLNAHGSVEKYNPVTNKWTKVDNLIQSRLCHSAGVFNGKIYVIGGYSDIIEAYDPQEKSWNFVSILPELQFKNARFIATEHYEQ